MRLKGDILPKVTQLWKCQTWDMIPGFFGPQTYGHTHHTRLLEAISKVFLSLKKDPS